eukprot:scaffold13696_cov207-Alexandrium_tamarense.AAC.3
MRLARRWERIIVCFVLVRRRVDQLTYKTQTNPARAVLEQVQVFEIPLANSLTMVADRTSVSVGALMVSALKDRDVRIRVAMTMSSV